MQANRPTFQSIHPIFESRLLWDALSLYLFVCMYHLTMFSTHEIRHNAIGIDPIHKFFMSYNTILNPIMASNQFSDVDFSKSREINPHVQLSFGVMRCAANSYRTYVILCVHSTISVLLFRYKIFSFFLRFIWHLWHGKRVAFNDSKLNFEHSNYNHSHWCRWFHRFFGKFTNCQFCVCVAYDVDYYFAFENLCTIKWSKMCHVYSL